MSTPARTSSPALSVRSFLSQSLTERVLWSCLALGTLLRVIWPLDFEWKFDEKWMFEKAQRVAHGLDPWPWVGMPSGVGTENPGASVWLFAALAKLTHTPASMTFAVMLINVGALWAFAAWVVKLWPEEDREVGLAGVALYAVSPLPVLFSRKIWAQDLLPMLLAPWWVCHSLRRRALPAFLWGLISALLGQVHLSGFFAAAALFLATLLLDRKQTRWLPVFAGGALGALPLIPWVQFVLSPNATHRDRSMVYAPGYFWEAFKLGFGIDLRYALVKEFGVFLRSPNLLGVKTWLVGGAHIALCLLALICAALLLPKLRSLRLSKPLQVYAATFVLGGLLMTALGIYVHVHYLIVFSPLVHIAVAWLVSQRQKALFACLALQLYITTSFIWYIHAHGGAARGDFGVSYRAQSAEQRSQDVHWP